MLPRHLLAVPAVQHRRLGLDLVGFAFLALVDLAPLERRDRPVRRFLGGRVQYGKNSLLSEKEASESSHYVASSVRKTHI